jgi:hypothetical protein
MTTTTDELTTGLDDAPGGSPEPVDPTERPDVDPAAEPDGGDDGPEVDPPADLR